MLYLTQLIWDTMIITTWSIILGLFILPVILVYYKTIRPKYRLFVLMGVGIFAITFSILQKWSLYQWGIRLDNFEQSFIPYLVFTLAGVIFVLITAWIHKRKPIKYWWKDPHLLFLFIPISIAQEVVYRGFLTPQLNIIFDSAISVVIFNALLFTFLHIIFYDFKYVLPLIFLGGIGFSWMYGVYPNLILVSISHCILNFLAVRHGFFSTEHLKERKTEIYNWIDRWGIIEQRKLSYTVHLLFVIGTSFVCVYLIKLKVIPAEYVLFLVIGIALLSLGVVVYQKFSFADLGIRKDFLFGFITHAVFTIAFSVLILVISLYEGRDIGASVHKLFSDSVTLRQFLASQIIISIGQAFVFRGFLVRQLQAIFDDSLVVVLMSATIFTLAHLMYVDFSSYSIVLFLAGLGFSWVYVQKPNLLWSSVSHVVLNVLAVGLGALSVV